ncbi:MAG TPA: response regulator transcription factor [Baekduia sp.]|nr:response regulator transcription factor [Baekduia sp.]
MSPTTSTSPLRVLLVDDAPELRMLLRALLADRDDVEVFEADSGEQALEVAAAHGPDLVVMDQNMPGMDGVTATRRLREEHRGVEVVAFTAVPGAERQFAEAGASAHFLKDKFDALIDFIGERASARGSSAAA